MTDPSGSGGSANEKFSYQDSRTLMIRPVYVLPGFSVYWNPLKRTPTFRTFSVCMLMKTIASGTCRADTMTWGLKEVPVRSFTLDQNGSLSFQAPSDFESESNHDRFSPCQCRLLTALLYVDANFYDPSQPKSTNLRYSTTNLNSTITFRNFTTPRRNPYFNQSQSVC